MGGMPWLKYPAQPVSIWVELLYEERDGFVAFGSVLSSRDAFFDALDGLHFDGAMLRYRRSPA